MNQAIRAFNKAHKTFWIVVVLLIAIRIALPYAIKYGINLYLGTQMASYQGHIEDFDLALYRGAYDIQDLKIWQRNKSEKHPFIQIETIRLSLAWRALFKGKLLGDLQVDQMNLVFVDSSDKNKQQLGKEDEDWKTVVGKLVPIQLESFKISNSEVHWVNHDFKFPIDVFVDQINGSATNIKNTDNKDVLLPSDVKLDARVESSAKLAAEGKMNLISKVPAFEVKISLEKLDLTQLNNFFLGYGPFTVTSGRFSIYSAIGTKDERVKGYVKPFFEKLDIIDPKEKFDSVKRAFNEYGLAFANLVLRNHKTKNVATKIEFEGESKDPKVHKWAALWISLKNGFGKALMEKLDNAVSIKDVPGKKKLEETLKKDKR